MLHLYKRILRVGNAWEATNPHETVVEREYILDETKTLFRYRYIPRDTIKDL